MVSPGRFYRKGLAVHPDADVCRACERGGPAILKDSRDYPLGRIASAMADAHGFSEASNRMGAERPASPGSAVF